MVFCRRVIEALEADILREDSTAEERFGVAQMISETELEITKSKETTKRMMIVAGTVIFAVSIGCGVMYFGPEIRDILIATAKNIEKKAA